MAGSILINCKLQLHRVLSPDKALLEGLPISFLNLVTSLPASYVKTKCLYAMDTSAVTFLFVRRKGYYLNDDLTVCITAKQSLIVVVEFKMERKTFCLCIE